MTLERNSLYIDGQWVAASGVQMDVINPFTEEVHGRFTTASTNDVDAAVKAAKRALKSWSQTSPSERVVFLEAIADKIEARIDEFAACITAEMGSPIGLAKKVQTSLPITVLRSQRKVLDSVIFEEQQGNSRVVREPIGVVAAITPWNYPLHQLVGKFAGAMVAGCTMVAKPSEEAPMSTYLFAEVAHEAGLPAGVFNLVTGTGIDVGEALVRHPGVDMVSFTGSTNAGKAIGKTAAEYVRPVALELGGKSANVILDDADLSIAVKVGVANAFMNAGQTCTAWTRMIVPRSRHNEVVELCQSAAAKYTAGDPSDPATRLGPLVSAAQRNRVLEHIKVAIEEDAELIAGGTERPEGLDKGFFVQPTIFVNVDPNSRLAQEEVFGPVLAVIEYDTEEEALAIANNSIYGLAGCVWSGDQDRAVRFANEMEAGQIDINGGAFNPMAPFGGYKQSGIGREFGPYGVHEFQQLKSLQF